MSHISYFGRAVRPGWFARIAFGALIAADLEQRDTVVDETAPAGGQVVDHLGAPGHEGVEVDHDFFARLSCW